MKSIKFLPVLVFASVIGVNSHVLAQDALLQQLNNYTEEGQTETQSQVTSVSQLRDVSPGDWAFEALRNLVERYGCISGYPDRTFRGNQPLTRYEFAAGLNACLQQIERLIGSSGGNRGEGIDQESLSQINKLTEEFKGELAALGARVDNLEAKVGQLEKQQFSTTTKLNGEVVMALASPLSGDVEKNPIFGQRTQLELTTSFTGEDELTTKLLSGNFPEYTDITGTPSANLAFAEPTDNDVILDTLTYRFPVGKNTEIVVAANAGASDDFAETLNVLDGDGGSGAISTFGTRNPIYRPVDGTGIGITTHLGSKFDLSAGYLAKEAANPANGAGLFDGPYNALGQLVFKPNDKLNIGLTYVYGYNSQDTGVGSTNSNFQDVTGPITSNSYSVELSWAISEKFVIGGWGGYTNSQILTGDKGSVDVWNWAGTLALKDLGKEGNLAGLIVGMQPKVTDSNSPLVSKDSDTSLHIEAFYQYQINDNIAITPGVMWLTSPDHNSNNNDIVIGTIRTTFTF